MCVDRLAPAIEPHAGVEAAIQRYDDCSARCKLCGVLGVDRIALAAVAAVWPSRLHDTLIVAPEIADESLAVGAAALHAEAPRITERVVGITDGTDRSKNVVVVEELGVRAAARPSEQSPLRPVDLREGPPLSSPTARIKALA
jgi:hypothetical protein